MATMYFEFDSNYRKPDDCIGLVIDYITLTDPDGNEVNLSCDTLEWSVNDDGHFSGRFKGVWFDDCSSVPETLMSNRNFDVEMQLYNYKTDDVTHYEISNFFGAIDLPNKKIEIDCEKPSILWEMST